MEQNSFQQIDDFLKEIIIAESEDLITYLKCMAIERGVFYDGSSGVAHLRYEESHREYARKTWCPNLDDIESWYGYND